MAEFNVTVEMLITKTVTVEVHADDLEGSSDLHDHLADLAIEIAEDDFQYDPTSFDTSDTYITVDPEPVDLEAEEMWHEFVNGDDEDEDEDGDCE